MITDDGLSTGDISAGGGQLYSCRDAARVGQLIASGGLWADADGKEIRLMSAEFAKGFVQPSFPEINPAYLLRGRYLPETEPQKTG